MKEYGSKVSFNELKENDTIIRTEDNTTYVIISVLNGAVNDITKEGKITEVPLQFAVISNPITGETFIVSKEKLENDFTFSVKSPGVGAVAFLMIANKIYASVIQVRTQEAVTVKTYDNGKELYITTTLDNLYPSVERIKEKYKIKNDLCSQDFYIYDINSRKCSNLQSMVEAVLGIKND